MKSKNKPKNRKIKTSDNQNLSSSKFKKVIMSKYKTIKKRTSTCTPNNKKRKNKSIFPKIQ